MCTLCLPLKLTEWDRVICKRLKKQFNHSLKTCVTIMEFRWRDSVLSYLLGHAYNKGHAGRGRTPGDADFEFSYEGGNEYIIMQRARQRSHQCPKICKELYCTCNFILIRTAAIAESWELRVRIPAAIDPSRLNGSIRLPNARK